MKIVEKLLRAGEGRILKKLDNIAAQVNAIEEDFEKLTDAELRAETDVFKKRLADGGWHFRAQPTELWGQYQCVPPPGGRTSSRTQSLRANGEPR